MIRLTASFTKLATVKNITLFFVLSFLANLLFALFTKGLNYGFPDAYLHYTANNFYALMEQYSLEEIGIYTRSIIFLDFLYPVFYSLFLALFIFRLSHKTFLSLLPFGVLIFDYFENLSVLTLIKLMPSRYDTLATIAGYFTLTKWILASFCLMIVLFYLGRYLVKLKFKQKE